VQCTYFVILRCPAPQFTHGLLLACAFACFTSVAVKTTRRISAQLAAHLFLFSHSSELNKTHYSPRETPILLSGAFLFGVGMGGAKSNAKASARLSLGQGPRRKEAPAVARGGGIGMSMSLSMGLRRWYLGCHVRLYLCGFRSYMAYKNPQTKSNKDGNNQRFVANPCYSALELIQPHMAQKPVLRVKVGCACVHSHPPAHAPCTPALAHASSLDTDLTRNTRAPHFTPQHWLLCHMGLY